MLKFRTPANILLRRAQLTLILAALVPTILMTAIGIVMIIVGSGSLTIVAGVLVLAFCTTAATGYILGSIFVSRGASLARVQNDFLSSVSHELRTPLTSIRMFIETLRDERLTDAQEKTKCLNLLDGEVERLEQLVSRVLELSRIEAGRHPMRREPLFLDDVIRDALAAFDAATLEHPSEIDLHVVEDIRITGDREMLSRAIGNLLINAWKYTENPDRYIGLSVRPHGQKSVEIRVTDNGPGIPRTEQKAIFDKFERGQRALDSQTGGVGLGLSIVRAIVRAHKGTAEVHSRGSRGAEFRIVLPRRRHE